MKTPRTWTAFSLGLLLAVALGGFGIHQPGVARASEAAAEPIGVKNLSGPPAEFADRGAPEADDLALSTHLLKPDWQPVAPSGDGEAATRSLTSSFSTNSGVGFTVLQVTTVYPFFGPLTLTAPNGTRYVFDGSTLTCNGGPCASDQAHLELDAFSSNTGGAAALSISGSEVTGGSWQMAEQSPLVLQRGTAPTEQTLQIDSTVAFDNHVVNVGIDPDPCLALAAFAEICPLQPARNSMDLVAGAMPTFRITGESTDADGLQVERRLDLTGLKVSVEDAHSRSLRHERTYTLNEAANLPSHADASALVQIPALEAGDYSVRLDIEGVLEGVGQVERTAFYFLPIRPQSHRLTGVATASVLDRGRLELGLGVEELGAGFLGRDVTHLHAYAEVWTRDGETPIAWIGGMTQPRTNASGERELPVVLDARWLSLGRHRATEYLLRNVRIQDPDSFVLLHEVAEIPFALERLPRAALAPVTKAVLSDETLLSGLGDRTIELPAVENGHRPTKNNLDTGIFLVHGWCSGPTWNDNLFPPGNLVGGTEEFADPDQSRSHDNFAQRIRTQGDACFDDSFSVVAHSQGGAAALHLRTFYTSGLDASTAPRRIQSMGTPYLGSTLMDLFIAAGPLAWLIAEIIGDCTPQVNLSTVGAALWQTNIPGWARDDVFYYRTRHFRPSSLWDRIRFWRWRCDFSSHVIPGYDDGVVSDSQGVLFGANNMGIRDGQCHTGGMTHMNQTDQKDDVARNAIMNVEGRPDPPPALQAVCRVQPTWNPGGPTGNGYFEYRVDASDSVGAVTDYRWRNGSGSWGSWTSNSIYGPLFPGLPGQASSYTISVQVRNAGGATSTATCNVP